MYEDGIAIGTSSSANRGEEASVGLSSSEDGLEAYTEPRGERRGDLQDAWGFSSDTPSVCRSGWRDTMSHGLIEVRSK